MAGSDELDPGRSWIMDGHPSRRDGLKSARVVHSSGPGGGGGTAPQGGELEEGGVGPGSRGG